MLYKRGGVYEDEMIGKVWHTSKEASFNKLNNSVDEPFTNKINNMHLEYRQSKGKSISC